MSQKFMLYLCKSVIENKISFISVRKGTKFGSVLSASCGEKGQNRTKTSCFKGGESENPVGFKDNCSDRRKRTGIKKGATPCSNLC